MKPDVICVWPQHLDYPIWRQFIHDNRSRFSKIIIVFTQMNTGKDYRLWLREQFNKDSIISIDNDQVLGSQDWRDVAVRKGLSYSDSKWIWFTEQDFITNENFWEEVKKISKADIIGVSQENRLHPCCIFIKREVLDKTNKDFSANPPAYDHFGQIQKDLMNFDPPLVGYTINPKLYEHLNGLSQNMYLLQIGQEPNYFPERFKEYCQKCLQIDLPIHPEIKELLENYVRR